MLAPSLGSTVTLMHAKLCRLSLLRHCRQWTRGNFQGYVVCRAALSSKISQLWRPLLEQGMGTGGVDSSGAGLAGALPPLQRQLAAVGIAAADMPQGQRLPLSGFVVAVAALLQAHLRDGLASGILQERLEVRASQPPSSLPHAAIALQHIVSGGL